MQTCSTATAVRSPTSALKVAQRFFGPHTPFRHVPFASHRKEGPSVSSTLRWPQRGTNDFLTTNSDGAPPCPVSSFPNPMPCCCLALPGAQAFSLVPRPCGLHTNAGALQYSHGKAAASVKSFERVRSVCCHATCRLVHRSCGSKQLFQHVFTLNGLYRLALLAASLSREDEVATSVRFQKARPPAVHGRIVSSGSNAERRDRHVLLCNTSASSYS